jgi:hypothetical protein
MQGTAHRHAQRTPIARPTDRSRGGAEREYVCACAAHRVPHHAADIKVQRRFASQVWLGARHMADIFEEIKAADATRGKNRKRPSLGDGWLTGFYTGVVRIHARSTASAESNRLKPVENVWQFSSASREPRGPCAPRNPCSRRRTGECPRASVPAPDWTVRPGSAGRVRRTAWCRRTATAL